MIFSNKILKLFLSFALAFFASTLTLSCGLDNSDSERQELVDRLRALGVAAVPLVSTIPADSESSQQVTLTVHVATPSNEPVAIEGFRNVGRKGANVVLQPSQIVIDETATQEQKVGNLRVISFKATVLVPSEKYWLGVRGGTVQYGFKVTNGSQSELISGEFLAFRSGQPELAWTNPTLAVKYPEAESIASKGANGEITMVISKSQSEIMLPGWFVSTGNVEQRRSETTNWKPGESGEHAVIATARGADSLGFAIQIVKVNVL